MNWFKRIFCSQEDFNVHENGLPHVTCDIPMPEVKPYKPEKNISEPVYAIIKTMQKYPSRFKVKYDEELSKNREFTLFRVTDTKTKEEVIYSTYYFYGKEHRLSWNWLTEDEVEILCEEGVKIYESKVERKKSLERARMKGVYNDCSK